jgi:hypothetical protein
MSAREENKVARLVPIGMELIVYVPDDGLHTHIRCRDRLASTDNEIELPFVLGDKALNALGDRSKREISEADAKAIARKYETRILVAIERWLENHIGASFPSGSPPRISAKDLV